MLIAVKKFDIYKIFQNIVFKFDPLINVRNRTLGMVPFSKRYCLKLNSQELICEPGFSPLFLKLTLSISGKFSKSDGTCKLPSNLKQIRNSLACKTGYAEEGLTLGVAYTMLQVQVSPYFWLCFAPGDFNLHIPTYGDTVAKSLRHNQQSGKTSLIGIRVSGPQQCVSV